MISKKIQRIKAVFIDATKEVIIREGAGNVTVRKIAEATGYSYATIYHYFKDLDHLLVETKDAMIGDLVSEVLLNAPEAPKSLEIFKKQSRAFLDYFVEKPNVFKFFYSYRLAQPTESETVITNAENVKQNSLGMDYRFMYRTFIEQGIITEADLPIVSKSITYASYGVLVLFFSNNGLSKEVIYNDLDEIIDYFLKKESGAKNDEIR